MQKGDGLDVEAFFGNVGENRKETLGVLFKVSGEFLVAAFSRREQPLAGQLPRMPTVGAHILGAEI